MNEFSLIDTYFKSAQPHRTDTLVGIGDDCALLMPDPTQTLAISVDTLVENRHFFADADPYLLGHKALAVNLSDLAAMGAEPKWFTLALTLPNTNPEWLKAFSAGLLNLAQQHSIQLIGGDTTAGPLSISISVLGQVPAQHALKRNGAQTDDDIWVTGPLGLAHLGLQHLQGNIRLADGDMHRCLQALHQPQAKVAIGLALRGIAHAAIDISDGLLADLRHILTTSNKGARLEWDAIPRLANATLPMRLQQSAALAGGDDYELCFTAPQQQRSQIHKIALQSQTLLYRVGQITENNELTVIDENQAPIVLSQEGYDHFG